MHILAVLQQHDKYVPGNFKSNVWNSSWVFCSLSGCFNFSFCANLYAVIVATGRNVWNTMFMHINISLIPINFFIKLYWELCLQWLMQMLMHVVWGPTKIYPSWELGKRFVPVIHAMSQSIWVSKSISVRKCSCRNPDVRAQTGVEPICRAYNLSMLDLDLKDIWHISDKY